jgi:hypothetical protein
MSGIRWLCLVRRALSPRGLRSARGGWCEVSQSLDPLDSELVAALALPDEVAIVINSTLSDDDSYRICEELLAEHGAARVVFSAPVAIDNAVQPISVVVMEGDEIECCIVAADNADQIAALKRITFP